MSDPISEESSRAGSQVFEHSHVSEDFNVVGEEDFQQEVVSKRTRSDGTISEHELKHMMHEETLVPLPIASLIPQRPSSPERLSRSSGRSTPRRSFSPRSFSPRNASETKSGSVKTRRMSSPEGVQVQTQTTETPPPREQPNQPLPAPPVTEDYPPPRTFDSHGDIHRASFNTGRNAYRRGIGVDYRGVGEHSPKELGHTHGSPCAPNDGAIQDGDALSPGDSIASPNWFVLYGTDYGPILISKEQLKLCEETLESKKTNQTTSRPYTPMLTGGNPDRSPFHSVFDGVNNPREVAVIWDGENKYHSVIQKTLVCDAASGGSPGYDSHDGIQNGSRLVLPAIPTVRLYNERCTGSDDKEEDLDVTSKPCRTTERLMTRMRNLETQVSCLAMEKSMLQDKLTQATLMINELSQCTPSRLDKCTSTNTEPVKMDCDSFLCSKTDAEIRKADKDYILSQKKAIELQNEIRELKCELQHLNDERLKLEMQQRQDDRCKLELYEELDASKKIEKEMKSCFQFMEQQNQKNEDEIQSTRLKLATLIQTLNPGANPVVDVLLRESTKTLQCILEKVVSSIQCKYLQTRSELDNTLAELRRVKEDVAKAETTAQGNGLKVQRLKDKLRQLKENMHSSMTDLTCKVKSREKDLECAQERLQDLLQQFSEKEHLTRNSQTRLDRLENQLHNLEVERDRCLQRLEEHRNKCKNRVDRLKDKYQQKIKCLMERLRDACQDCDVLRGKVLQIQHDESREQEDGERLTPLINQLERACREASNVMESLQQTIRMRDDSDISECKKRLDDLDGKVCKVASDCNINQSKSPAINDLASRLNEALKLIDTLRNNAEIGHHYRKRSWTSCHVVPRVAKPAISSTNLGSCCRTIERCSDDRAAIVQEHIARAQAWAQNVLQASQHAPCSPPPPTGLVQTPFCTVYPPAPLFYSYPSSSFSNFPTTPKCSPAAVHLPTSTTTTCNFVEHSSPRAISGCTNAFSQGELNADHGCAQASSPTMAYQLSSRTIGLAKHDVVFPAFTKHPDL